MDRYYWAWISQVKQGDTFLYRGQADVHVLAIEEGEGGFVLTLQRAAGGKVVARYYKRETLLYVKVIAARMIAI